jgi:hypothetical protein
MGDKWETMPDQTRSIGGIAAKSLFTDPTSLRCPVHWQYAFVDMGHQGLPLRSVLTVAARCGACGMGAELPTAEA